MYHRHFFLALSLGCAAAISAAGDQNVQSKQIQAHENYYHAMAVYKELYATLIKESQKKDVYTLPESREKVKEAVKLLASLTASSGSKVTLRNGLKVNLPSAADAYTEKNLARTLFETALKKGDKDGVLFLAKEYTIDPNSATMRSRTALDALDANPVAMLNVLLQLGLDKKQINTWNADGRSAVHLASTRVVENYSGYQNPEAAFQAQIRQGIITLPVNALQEAELEVYRLARKTCLEQQRDLLLEFKKHGARDLPDKDGKKPSDILAACSDKEGPCKEAYDAFIAQAAQK